MPFSCQLNLPAYNGSPIEAKLVSWSVEFSSNRSFVMLEKGDLIAKITIGDIAHSLFVNFPCGLSGLIAHEGDTIKTGDCVATCAAEGEDIPYGRDYLVIRA